MADDELQRIFQLQSSLKQKAPKLAPLVLPRGLDPEAVLSKKQKKQLAQRMSNNPNCTICGLHSSEVPIVNWQLDIKKMGYKLKGLEAACSNCANVMNLKYFLTRAGNDGDVNSLASHFLAVNEHENDEMATVQEVYSLAYALAVIVGQIPASSFRFFDEDSKSA
eukprot:TRINITY_DN1019_c0_g3_i2.p1 TRINITY_DN1019_c0_g3~~TRINITY_DN1019_c0_g3_i2.p1  ORF type:complete len:165 (+),score=15.77 TRINITY_DN1019_c0_g3_i2:82-576(+)